MELFKLQFVLLKKLVIILLRMHNVLLLNCLKVFQCHGDLYIYFHRLLHMPEGMHPDLVHVLGDHSRVPRSFPIIYIMVLSIRVCVDGFVSVHANYNILMHLCNHNKPFLFPIYRLPTP